MSDAPQGPGWWLANDGRYYPPEDHPRYQPPPAPPPLPPLRSSAQPRGITGAWRRFRGLSRWIQVVVWTGLVVIVIAAGASGQEPKDQTVPTTERVTTTPEPTAPTTTKPTTDRRYEAFEICKKFVKDRLKAPTTATFRNFFENDGEVLVGGEGDGPYVVASTVDSENSFGAKIRSTFGCTVTLDGTSWHLDDISIKGP